MGSLRAPRLVHSFLHRVRRRVIAPAGIALAIGFASLAPGVGVAPAAGGTASATRDITPGKRRDEVVDVYERVKASVVNIHSERTVAAPAEDPFNRLVRPQQVNGMGTGIVLDPRGYVLTNFHVVDEVNSLRIRLHDGTSLGARVLATDKEADLALIKIDPPSPLPVMPFGTSSDLMIGEPVIAIGNAFGYEHTVTFGRVSYKGRDVTLNKEMGYKGLIQTSAAINPGNSGGPLLNVLGELVGVNVAIRAGAQNIGFALPVDFVIGHAADMLGQRRGSLRHGLVVRNVVTRDATEAPARRQLKVEAVEPHSPAAEAGFKPGDVIDRVDNVAVFTSIDLERALLDKGPESKATVALARGSAKESVSLSFEQAVLKPLTPPETAWKRLGIRVGPVGADAVAKANPQLHGGLVVTEVAVGGTAATAGIQKGDILVGLHSWETLRVEDIAFVLNHKDFASFLPLKFFVARDGKLRDGWFAGTP
jgi:serine protease Do